MPRETAETRSVCTIVSRVTVGVPWHGYIHGTCDTYRDVFDRVRCRYRYVRAKCRRVGVSRCAFFFGDAKTCLETGGPS